MFKIYKIITSRSNYIPIKLFILLFIFSTFKLTAQIPNIILGRPTDSSITASIMFETEADFFLELGTESGVYTKTGATYHATPHTPLEVEIDKLQSDKKYYYHIKFKPTSSSVFISTAEYTFHTQRSASSTFSFTIESDEHLYDKKGVRSLYEITLANQAADEPDFMLSLGDIFGDDHEPFTISSGALDSLHKDYRPFLGKICHSIPFYVCLGNHEGENDYYYHLNPPNNLCVWGTQWRKFYYPNPYPNSFYSGNTAIEPFGIGNPENYYAWTWGNALFVVLDVYRDQNDSSAKPGAWNWSLGLPQYTWLKNTLESSTATFKFVFAHHIRGQGRGGITNAKLFEWGGYDGQGGTNYNFPNKRPGWAKPIHQLFKDNGVNIFFQGHDHVFAHEIMDNVTYQSLPMAADSTYEIGMLANADAYTSDTLEGSGHLRVQVSPSCVKVEFIRAYLPADTLDGKHHNREVAFSYTIGNCSSNGMNEMNQNELVAVFPNPAQSSISVKLNNSEMIPVLRLMSLSGQIIQETISNEMDIKDITNGIYLLKVFSEGKSSTHKIIVLHD